MASNLYKVGDWVYCEVAPHQPYVIRKIEELTKTPCGNVEAKVICAFRRQDIPANILATVEKYQSKNTATENKTNDGAASGNTADPTANTCDYDESLVANLNEQQRYNLKHRELYFSKYTDTIAAATLRAKCSVLLFNEEVETYSDYLSKDDTFFYHLTYDPYQKSIVADKGEIRVGQRYQADIPHLKVTPNGSVLEDLNDANTQSIQNSLNNDRVLRSQLQKMANSGERGQKDQPEVPISLQLDEILNWSPIGVHSSYGNYFNQLTDREIDQFLIIAKSVGTFARALDCNNAFKQPSLPLSAAAASRDITIFHAMNILHENNYDIGKAALSLITNDGPVLCKDEIEDWSASEAGLFEDALEKYGKDFNEIRKDFLPWKTIKSIIEYYYTWKTTDRYVQQKRIKLSEQESKLKQVYIPVHPKQNQSSLIKSVHAQLMNQYDTHLKMSCESCGAPNISTNQWYIYNPSNLTQLIMSGNHNPTVLANAAAAQIALNSNGGTTALNAHSNVQARLCADCWMYWKRFAAFKYPNARQERLNQLKNQVHKCSVNGCGREFKMKQLLIKHCGIAHGYFAKTNNPPPGQNGARPAAMRNRTSFYLLTTPMTQAARLVCTNTIKLKKLARKPFKLVELAELNKEWIKETRDISLILAELKKKKYAKRELSKQLISTISKSYARILKRKKKEAASSVKSNKVNGLNGNHTHDDAVNEDDDDDDEDVNELVIDNEDENESKPEFLKYFEKKCDTACYTPEQFAYPKPNETEMNKFYANLISQNRKRPHDSVGTTSDSSSSATNGKNGLEHSDSSPLSKRSNLNISQNKSVGGKAAALSPSSTTTTQPSIAKQSIRMAQKSIKPTQSINMLNASEEIYYAINRNLKTIRREIQLISLRRLARKPYKLMNKQYHNLYQTFADLRTQSLAKLTKKATEEAITKLEQEEKTDTSILNGNSKENGASISDEAVKQDEEMISDETEVEKQKEKIEKEENEENENEEKDKETKKTNGNCSIEIVEEKINEKENEEEVEKKAENVVVLD